jgi:hypothetical protein
MQRVLGRKPQLSKRGGAGELTYVPPRCPGPPVPAQCNFCAQLMQLGHTLKKEPRVFGLFSRPKIVMTRASPLSVHRHQLRDILEGGPYPGGPQLSLGVISPSKKN